MLQVIDCLEVREDTWICFDTLGNDNIIVPKDCFNKDDWFSIFNDSIKEEWGWCYRWCESGKDCLTDNPWSTVYTDKQECFNEAYAALNNNEDDGGENDLEWLRYAKDNELDDKVVITAMNSYPLSVETSTRLITGDY